MRHVAAKTERIILKKHTLPLNSACFSSNYYGFWKTIYS